MFSVTTHNGIITIKNPKTGNHRTFLIKTQKKDAKFMPGERIIHLLTGSDNTKDYTSFGILKDDKVVLWKRYRNSDVYLWYKKFFENFDRMQEKLEINFEGKCRVCNRPLTTPDSVSSGIGPICSKKAA